MTETVGGVSYSVDVDYGQLDKLDSKIDQVGKSASQSFGAVDKSVKSASGSMGNLNKTSAAVSNAFKVQKGAAQQLSFQLQDVVVQAQMGTSAFTIIAQQAPQILSLAGAGGALLGVAVALAAAIGGVAYKASQASSDVITLEDAVKMLGDAVQFTDDGVALLTEEITRLAKVSQDAAMAQLAQEIVDAKNVITASVSEIGSSFGGVSNAIELAEGAFHLYRQAVDDGTAAQENLTLSAIDVQSPIFRLQQLISQFNSELKLSTDQSYQLAAALFEVRNTRSAESIQELQNTLAAINKETGFTNQELGKFASKLSEAFSQARNAGEIIQAAEGFLNNFSSALDSSTESAVKQKGELQKLIETIARQSATLGMTQRGIALYAAEQYKATDADKQRINELFNLIEAQESADKVEKERISNAERALSLQARQIAQDQAKAVADAKKAGAAFSDAVSGAQRDIESPAETAARELSERLDVIKNFFMLESEEQARRTDAGIMAEQAYQKKLTQIKKQEEDKRLQMNNTTLGATADLFGNLASLAEQGGKKSFNAWKLFASAQAAVNAALAITNVLATVPPPLSFALAASVAAITGAQIGQIASTSYGSGRLYGGPVDSGKIYPITENGKPEILQQGAKQYLLPGSRGGNVVSNRDMQQTSGGMNVQINVQNNTPSNVDVQRRQGPDKTEIIDIVVADIKGRGKTLRAITDTTTASNKL